MFGFGGSVSSSSSQSTSFDQSESGSVSGGFGVAGSNQNIAFEDVFARLFGGAEGAAAGLDPSMLTEAANTLFSGGFDVMSGLGADAGSQYMQDRLASDNPVLEDQIGLLGEDLGKFFNDELLPGITSEAVGGGQLGGGRQGVAQGRAVDAVGEQFTRGATALRAGDIAARDATAGALAGNHLAGIGTYLQGIPGLAGVADMGFAAGMQPYERLAAILGGPTALTSSFSSSGDFARAYSSSYGESQATSESSSAALSMGF